MPSKTTKRKNVQVDKVHRVEVVRHGKELIVPDTLPYDDAIKILQDRMKYEEQLVQISESVPVLAADGAIAMGRAAMDTYGYLQAFNNKTAEMSVEDGHNSIRSVPWGNFMIPGAEHKTPAGQPMNIWTTSTALENGMWVYCTEAVIQRKHEEQFREFLAMLRKYALATSIYQNQAIRVRFRDDNGDQIRRIQPRFLDLSRVALDDLVYNTRLEQAIHTNIWTPIRHPEECREIGVPLKRGVLLEGPYGCGKTLLAYATAKIATDAKWTFLYVRDVRELPDAIAFARTYAPCVIFAEDIDRVMGDGNGQRTIEMDTILNTIDGVDSKDTPIMVVLTTNHIERIHEAMLRPGRLDVMLTISPPDADAVQRLVHVYGRGLVREHAELGELGEQLKGCIPAVIRECVERAKLEFLRRTGSLQNMELDAPDLMAAAFTLGEQQKLLQRGREVKEPVAVLAAQALGTEIAKAIVMKRHGTSEDQIDAMLRNNA